MALKYEIKDTENSFRVCIGSYVIAEVMYKADRCTTPMSREEAEKLIETIKNHFELQFPVESLDAEEYEPSDFYKFLESLEGNEDDDEKHSKMSDDLMKLMFLKAMLD